MKQLYSNKQGFSIIVAVFMIGFLLVLTTWVFNLVLREMKDNRWAENYLKAYAWAEWAMELWLLNIKEKGYSTDIDLLNTDSGSESLSFNSTFKKINDPKISYNMDIAVDQLSWMTMTGWETVLIPLFSNGVGVTNPTFTSSNDILWNIVWNWEWMSWSGSFDLSTSQIYKKNDGTYSSLDSVQSFLTVNTASYLMLFNKWWPTTYDFSVASWELFSRPVWKITSSVTVWKYKQNISTSIDNTQFLNMLKYSLYSN